jgi:hypothetical protein
MCASVPVSVSLALDGSTVISATTKAENIFFILSVAYLGPMYVKCNLQVYNELHDMRSAKKPNAKVVSCWCSAKCVLRLGRTSEGVHKVDAGKMQRLNVACARSF